MAWSALAACGALLLSFLPLAVVAGGGASDPWLFNLVYCLMGVPVLGVTLAASCRRGVWDFLARFLRLCAARSVRPGVALCVLGPLDWAVFTWAASIGDPVTVVVLSRLAPLVVVSATAASRREPLSLGAWAGICLVVLGGALASAAGASAAGSASAPGSAAALALLCSVLTACLYFGPALVVPMLARGGTRLAPWDAVLALSLLQTVAGAAVSLVCWLALRDPGPGLPFSWFWIVLACIAAQLGGLAFRWVALRSPSSVPNAFGAFTGPFALFWFGVSGVLPGGLALPLVFAAGALLLAGLLCLALRGTHRAPPLS